VWPARGQAGSVYGRQVCEVQRYRDDQRQFVGDDLEGAIRRLKAERDGEIEVVGPALAGSLTDLGLIDEYRIYLHPVVVGHGKPYVAGPRPRLRLVTNDRIAEDVIRLTYVAA
jgi:dihydrofolate reductase